MCAIFSINERQVLLMGKRKPHTTFYDTMLCQGREMNGRQRYFAQMILEEGFYTALRCSGYDKKYGYKLMRDPRFKRYQMSLINDAMDEIHLTLAELIKKRYELANDIETPPTLRNSIYTGLINMIIEASESTPAALKLTGDNKMLKPSKEVQEADKENKK